ncbi:hypothetical protein SDC9_185157 [bioreactor metagenome]|uniref:Type IV secretory pathway, VirB3-like protein n=1 Tax=bioreactor metagenome TaxID=1076179 RepID=A0A645HF21_9ZZZZ
MRKRHKGTSITIHKSLTNPMMLGGVPQKLAIFNFGIGAALGFGGGAYYLIGICVFIHIALAYAHRDDEQFFICMQKYFSLSKYYTT